MMRGWLGALFVFLAPRSIRTLLRYVWRVANEVHPVCPRLGQKADFPGEKEKLP